MTKQELERAKLDFQRSMTIKHIIHLSNGGHINCFSDKDLAVNKAFALKQGYSIDRIETR